MIYPRLKTVTPLKDYKLMLVFGDNEKRIFDFKPHLEHKFYAPLTDTKLFSLVSVTEGELEWATGQDFCPHTLYEQSKPV